MKQRAGLVALGGLGGAVGALAVVVSGVVVYVRGIRRVGEWFLS